MSTLSPVPVGWSKSCFTRAPRKPRLNPDRLDRCRSFPVKEFSETELKNLVLAKIAPTSNPRRADYEGPWTINLVETVRLPHGRVVHMRCERTAPGREQGMNVILFLRRTTDGGKRAFLLNRLTGSELAIWARRYDADPGTIRCHFDVSSHRGSQVVAVKLSIPNAMVDTVGRFAISA
jgi:hypothetical protein